MSWYHKFLRILSFRNQYDLLSNQLSKKIWDNIVRDFKANNKLENKEIEFIEGEFFVSVYIRQNYSRNLRYGFFDIYALASEQDNEYNKKDKKMIIDIEYNSDFSFKDLNNLYGYLTFAIRHELGHVVSDNIEDVDKIYTTNIVLQKYVEERNYLLKPNEMINNLRAIMQGARKVKRQFVDFLDEFLNSRFFSDDLQKQHLIKMNLIKNVQDYLENRGIICLEQKRHFFVRKYLNQRTL